MTNKIKYLIQIVLCWCMVLMPAMAEDAKVLILAGADSHGWGSHEHHAGAKLLAQALSESGLEIRAEVVEDSWPGNASAFDGVKALVVYCDGQDAHVLKGHAEDVATLQNGGMGLVCLHYAVEVSPGDLRKTLMDGIGGYFETDWSVNPFWTPKPIRLGDHPISQGVEPFEIEDEWYYHMRFRPNMAGVTPILSALPPGDTLAEEDGLRSGNPALREELEQGKWQHLAWASVNENDSRGFGFTGAHTHSNWSNDNFRKLVLNGIVWAAGLTVPPDGVPSETPIIVRNESLMHAIAKGDAEDVERYVLLGTDVNERIGGGWAPLHHAVVRNRQNVGAVLIRHGADVNVLSAKHNAPIHFCAERGLSDFARLLIAHGADLGLRDSAGWSPLHIAAAKNRAEMIRLLIEAGADVNARSEGGGTPLHEAAASAGREVIELLLEHGADSTMRAPNGNTALDYAVQLNNPVAAELLKE